MKWEYVMGGNLNANQLDEYGGQGWELVSVVAEPGRLSTELLFFFKRQLINHEGNSSKKTS